MAEPESRVLDRGIVEQYAALFDPGTARPYLIADAAHLSALRTAAYILLSLRHPAVGIDIALLEQAARTAEQAELGSLPRVFG